MRKVAQSEFDVAVKEHGLWLRKEAGGKRLNFSHRDISGVCAVGADLRFASLTYANLTGADLRGVNLSGADLCYANLSGADLTNADLSWLVMTGANLTYANLTNAELSGADLDDANLHRADLTGADLHRANLTGADLSGAHLFGADLTRAELTGANLTNVIGLVRPDVGLIEDPDGWCYAFKAVTKDRRSPEYPDALPQLVYADGATLEVSDADTSETLCGAGINVATLEWCKRIYPTRIIVKVRFRCEDVAIVPYASDGKFRLFRCEVVGEVKP